MNGQLAPFVFTQDSQARNAFQHLVNGALIIFERFPFNIHMEGIFIGFSDNRHRLYFGEIDPVFAKVLSTRAKAP
jgi:hypothetical protein